MCCEWRKSAYINTISLVWVGGGEKGGGLNKKVSYKREVWNCWRCKNKAVLLLYYMRVPKNAKHFGPSVQSGWCDLLGVSCRNFFSISAPLLGLFLKLTFTTPIYPSQHPKTNLFRGRINGVIRRHYAMKWTLHNT